MSDYRFKVNLSGMIEILSDHLYSSPDVYIRELLQNAVDAIVARKKSGVESDGDYSGEIHVFLEEEGTLRFIDNGIGLTEEEIHRFLAIIGESSKKELEDETLRTDYIGRFGIGLLSCFMVSDEIKIITKSVSSENAYVWEGKPDGTYSLDIFQEGHEEGTEVILSPKKGAQQYFEFETVRDLLIHYGILLPYPVYLSDGEKKIQSNPVNLPWEKANVDKSELMRYGQIMFGMDFLDAVVLKSQSGEASGVAYILPYSVATTIKQKHLIYLKNMLLTENGEDILPEWAFFTKCIINTKALRPTASREGFYIDDVLEKTRYELGKCISDYLLKMSQDNPALFRTFMDTHDLALRGMAVSDDELFDIFIDKMEFHTSKGYLTGQELKYSNEALVYAYMNEYRQLSQIFISQNRLLINVGYVYSMELISRLAEKYNLDLVCVDESIIDNMLKDVSPSEAEAAVTFLEVAEEALKPFNVDVEIKQYIPSNLPAFYYIDDRAKLYQQVQDTMEKSGNLFAGMLDNFASSMEKVNPVIYFNLQNPVVKKLVSADDAKVTADIVTIIYVQTLLLGGFYLRNNEMGIMNEKLLTLFDRCI